ELAAPVRLRGEQQWRKGRLRRLPKTTSARTKSVCSTMQTLTCYARSNSYKIGRRICVSMLLSISFCSTRQNFILIAIFAKRVREVEDLKSLGHYHGRMLDKAAILLLTLAVDRCVLVRRNKGATLGCATPSTSYFAAKTSAIVSV